jgi:hypothetical protein
MLLRKSTSRNLRLPADYRPGRLVHSRLQVGVPGLFGCLEEAHLVRHGDRFLQILPTERVHALDTHRNVQNNCGFCGSQHRFLLRTLQFPESLCFGKKSVDERVGKPELRTVYMPKSALLGNSSVVYAGLDCIKHVRKQWPALRLPAMASRIRFLGSHVSQESSLY